MDPMAIPDGPPGSGPAPDAPLGTWYAEARARIAALASNGDVGSVRVPATPAWDVHDVVAHLAGIATDAVNGNLEGVTTDPWTNAQVERGRGRNIAELVAEWDANGPFVEAYLDSVTGADVDPAARAVIDVLTHEADLRGALDRPVALPDAPLGWCAARLRRWFDASVAAAGLPGVAVDAGDLEWFRGRLGRRTADEVCAYGWSKPPEAYLDVWFVFGRAEAPLGERAA